MPENTLAFIPYLKFPLCVLVMLTLLQSASLPARGQQRVDDPERARALKLYESSNYVEAVPLLEKIAVANPNDVFILYLLEYVSANQ